MISVFDAANYFLSLADEEAGDLISNLKLQKLVYYAQGFYLALFDTPLFDEPIEAWTHGPVAPTLYHAYKDHGAGPIPRPQGFDPAKLDGQTSGLLDEVYTVYGQYSAWKLRNMTHDESPWANAYQTSPGSVIPQESMKEHFKTLLN